MDVRAEYDKLWMTLIDEHTKVFQQQDLSQIEALMDEIAAAKRIFLIGAGREGISTRAFAMRLEHMGKETHWVWDDTTPGIHEGDLMILVSGSGVPNHIYYVAEQTQKTGARLAVVTGAPLKIEPLQPECILFVPACVYKGTDPRVVPSIQPMGNLFEQHLMLLYDIIIMLLQQKMNVSSAEMESRHRNVE